MIEEKDLQAIGALLSKQLKENNKSLKDEITSEIGEVAGEAFRSLETRFDGLETRFDGLESRLDKLEADVKELKTEMAKRPTKNEIFDWADRRIIDLEIGKERHDYLHINELDKLPTPSEINRILIERGFKQKLA